MEDEDEVKLHPGNLSYDKQFKDTTSELDKKTNSFNESLRTKKFNKNSSNFVNLISKVGSPVYRGENTGFGESKYDNNLNWDADIGKDIQDSINEHRAQEQSGLTQAAEIIPRAATKAIAEVAKLPGVVGGIIASPFAEKNEKLDTAFNNWWIKGIDKILDKVDDAVLPVYTARAVRTGDLWDNMKSTSFYATDGADGLGFVVAMMAPSAIFEYAGLGGKLLDAGRKSAQILGMTEKTEAAVSVLKGMGITGSSIDSGLAIAGNTIFEAGSEAKGVGDDLDRKKAEFVDQYKKTYDYKDKVSKKQKEIQYAYDSGNIQYTEYEEKYNNIKNEIAEDQFKEQRALAMRNTFLSNVVILLGPNAIMYKAIWGKAADKFERTASTGLKRVGKSLEHLGTAAVSEGFWEEGSQSTVENMYVKKAMNNQLGKDDSRNYFQQAKSMIGDFADEYANTVSSTEGQKAILLGGLLGGPMMSFQGRKEEVRNAEKTNSVLNGIESQLNNFNDIFKTDVYLKDEEGNYIYKKDKNGNETTNRDVDLEKALEVAKSLKFTEEQSAAFDEAVQSGDTDVVDEIKKQAIFNLILPSINNGELGIKALEEKLNSDSKFQEIVERDKTSDNKNSTKTFIAETLETAKYLQKQNDKFQSFSKDIIEIGDKNSKQEDKDEFLRRLNISYINTKNKIRNNDTSLKELEEKRNNIFDELGIDPLYDSNSEFPTAKMKNGLISDEDLMKRAETTAKMLKENPLLAIIENRYNQLKNTNDKLKKDISDIWGGKLVNESFNDFVNKKENFKKEIETEEELNAIFDKINNATNLNDLKDIKSTNEIVKEKIKEKKKAIKDLEDIAKQEEINKQFENQKEKEVFEDENLTEEKPEKTPSTSTEYNYSTDGADNHDELVETKSKNLEGVKLDVKLSHPKLISTDRNTGEKLDFIEQNFLDYERNPIDKKGKEVSFGINKDAASKNKNWKKALDILDSKDFSQENIDFLINHLPINVFVADNVFAPIETMPTGVKAQDIFNDSSKLIRTMIINELIKGTDINDIKSNIFGQFQGDLVVEDEVLENPINELDSVQKGLVNIVKNIFMINDQKDKQYSDGRIEPFVNSDKERVKGVGEIYLNIPQANGQIYPLKLNIRKLNRKEAEVLADLYELRLKKEINNETLLSSLDDELKAKINENLKEALKVIMSKGKAEKDVTIKDIIRFLVWDGKPKGKLNNETGVSVRTSTNKKSTTALDGTGVLGETKLVYGNNSTLDLQDKEHFINWLIENKRHNIRFKSKKNEAKTDKIDINDKVYLDYLISSNTLNTNAVVNQPTFQGYSNIYLNNEISVKGTKISGENKEAIGKEKVKNDIEAKKADIERRRQEGTNARGTTYKGETTEKDGLKVTKYSEFRSDGKRISKGGRIMTPEEFIEEYNITDQDFLDSLEEATEIRIYEVRVGEGGRSGISIQGTFPEGNIEMEVAGTELAALEQPTTQAKKADIEKRREYSLTTIGEWSGTTINGRKEGYKIDYITPENFEKRNIIFERNFDFNSKEEAESWVNVKYDAELSVLTQSKLIKNKAFEEIKSSPISSDYSEYNPKKDGSLNIAEIDGVIYRASNTSGRVFESVYIDTDKLKAPPKDTDGIGKLVTDNDIISKIQDDIRNNPNDFFRNEDISLNFYENTRNTENNFVPLQDIPNSEENKELVKSQEKTNLLNNISQEKQNEILSLLSNKIKQKVSLLKDKNYLALVKQKDSQKIYDYLINLAKENDIDVNEIEKLCK